jgi:hypothetical protein
MLIVYVGGKPSKADNVAGTGLVWSPGQSHEVADPLACAKLLRHTGVWMQAPANPPERGITLPISPDEDDALSADADALKATQRAAIDSAEEAEHQSYLKAQAETLANPEKTQDELRAALDAKGIKYHHKAGAKTLSALLESAQ